MASVKFVAVSRGLRGIVDYVTNREKTNESLISGVNCLPQTVVEEFQAVKLRFHKTEGRSYYHIVQAFSPDDPLDFATAHEIGVAFAQYFQGYQCLVATHQNTAHIHNHIILNSVSFETGKKFHQSAKEMRQAKEYSNQLCREHGLSVTEAKADPSRIPRWKRKLRQDIRAAMEHSHSREEFIHRLETMGYRVKWEPGQKYITYTTEDNVRCRDSKLFDPTLLRENMELYFAMGGAAYLDTYQAVSAESGLGLDDAVWAGLGGRGAPVPLGNDPPQPGGVGAYPGAGRQVGPRPVHGGRGRGIRTGPRLFHGNVRDERRTLRTISCQHCLPATTR